MADDFTLVIYDSKIAAMSLPGGQTWRWARQRRSRVERLAKMKVKSRSGTLVRSIVGSYDPAPPNQIVMEVAATADHAVYVHEGTVGPILPINGPLLYLRAGNGFSPRRERFVRGQAANPFLANALREVMRDL